MPTRSVTIWAGIAQNGATVRFWDTTHSSTLILKSIEAFNFGAATAVIDFHTHGPAGSPLVAHVEVPTLKSVRVLPWVVYSPTYGGDFVVSGSGPVTLHLSGAHLPGGSAILDGDTYLGQLPA